MRDLEQERHLELIMTLTKLRQVIAGSSWVISLTMVFCAWLIS